MALMRVILQTADAVEMTIRVSAFDRTRLRLEDRVMVRLALSKWEQTKVASVLLPSLHLTVTSSYHVGPQQNTPSPLQ